MQIYRGFAFSASKIIISSLEGYVVSWEVVRRFGQEAIPCPERCKTSIRPIYHGDEDEEFGVYLHSVEVFTGTTRDAMGRQIFFPWNPLDLVQTVSEDYRKWDWVIRLCIFRNKIG